jgi:nucleoside-diphosphate-sugar epimerase
MAQKLLGSLQIDASKTRELLNWAPPISLREGLRSVARSWSNPATSP